MPDDDDPPAPPVDDRPRPSCGADAHRTFADEDLIDELAFARELRTNAPAEPPLVVDGGGGLPQLGDPGGDRRCGRVDVHGPQRVEVPAAPELTLEGDARDEKCPGEVVCVPLVVGLSRARERPVTELVRDEEVDARDARPP